MSCNPSIGGVGKGTLVREIDALGGLIGRIADKSGIHFKNLNSSKGAAVWGPRAQIDRDAYKQNMQEAIISDSRLNVVEGSVQDLMVEKGECVGVTMQDGTQLRAKSVVLTTGTFLGGVCWIGDEAIPAGRFMRQKQGRDTEVEPASNFLSQSIKRYFPLGRLRTGTPPRLDKSTIDYSQLETQDSDKEIKWFSFENEFQGYQI